MLIGFVVVCPLRNIYDVFADRYLRDLKVSDMSR